MAACGGDRYQLSTNKEGQTLRLDKRTGDVAILDGGRMVSVKGPAALARAESIGRALEDSLGTAKKWPTRDISNIGVDSATLVTRYRDGLVLFQLELKPIPTLYTSSISEPFTLFLYDADGFQLAERALTSDELHRVVDSTGRVRTLEANGSLYMSTTLYKVAAKWTLSWRASLDTHRTARQER